MFEAWTMLVYANERYDCRQKFYSWFNMFRSTNFTKPIFLVSEICHECLYNMIHYRCYIVVHIDVCYNRIQSQVHCTYFTKCFICTYAAQRKRFVLLETCDAQKKCEEFKKSIVDNVSLNLTTTIRISYLYLQNAKTLIFSTYNKFLQIPKFTS